MYWVGLVLLVITIILTVFVILGEIIDFDGEILLLSLMLFPILYFFSIVMMKEGKSKDSTDKVEVVEKSVPLEESNLLTLEFFESAHFINSSYGVYLLEYPYYYKVDTHEVFIIVEGEFDNEEKVLFDSITTIDQLREFYKLLGKEEEFNNHIKLKEAT